MVRENLTFSYIDSLIISCEYFEWNYDTSYDSPCMISIQQIFIPDYTDCYTMSVDSSQSTLVPTGNRLKSS